MRRLRQAAIDDTMHSWARCGVGLALLAGMATAVSDCSGASRLSRDELAKRANAICARYGPAYATGKDGATRKAVLRYLDRNRPVAAREERELRALRAGPHGAAKVRRLLDNVHAARLILDQLRVALAKHKDARSVTLVRRLGVVGRRTSQEARALGWTVCASPPQAS
jgi:hypothetical protein